MRHGSLFSGIGGFDLASEWMGWENVFHCEWNEFGKQVLKYYWPNAISYDDITKTDFTIHRGHIDIISGGFPCQPYSAAGKRLGKEDDRHLWPEMLRAIREIQPSWVVGENVFGLVNWSGGLVFHEVQTDLEAAGYEVFPYVLPACAVNAPHRRDRIWFVAYNNIKCMEGSEEVRRKRGKRKSERDKIWREDRTISSERPTPNANNPRAGEQLRTDRNRQAQDQRRQGQPQPEFGEISGFTPNPDSNGQHGGNSNDEKHTSKGGFNAFNDVEQVVVTDTGDQGLQGGKINGSTRSSRQERNEQPTGCIPPDWRNFPTQSPIRTRNDGISDRLDGITFPKWRNESIKAYGNAIVPQVALNIFKAIHQYETL